MKEPIIFHQTETAASGRKMNRVLCVLALLWSVFSVLVFLLSKNNFTLPVIVVFFLGFASLAALYFRIRTMPRSGGVYRILVSDQYLIRESSHEWFGKPFRIPLSSISELIVEKSLDRENPIDSFFVRLADSSRIKIVPDYGFSPEAMFNVLLKLGVVTSIARTNAPNY